LTARFEGVLGEKPLDANTRSDYRWRAVKVEQQVDGTMRFRLRFTAYGKRETLMLHEDRDCDCGCNGNWNERTARVELANILARVKAGIWKPPKRQSLPVEQVFTTIPTFHEYVSYWLKAKIEGVIGEKPINENTAADYRSRIRHLISFFGRYQLNEIDAEPCLAFKKHKIKEAHEIKEALAAGADLRDHRNRKVEPLSPSSVKKLITLLASICDEAVEDKLMPANPARGKRLKIHVPKPKRTFLEMDELVVLEDAAGEQDPNLERFAHAARQAPAGSSAAAVAVRLAEGKRQKQIGAELELSKGTIYFHVRNLGGLRVGRYVGRKAIVATLGKSGVRNGELCDIRIGHLRLHDPEGARFRIPTPRPRPAYALSRSAPIWPRYSSSRSTGCAAPATTRAPRRTYSRTNEAGACHASGSERSSAKPPSERTRAARAGPTAAPAHHSSQPPPHLHIDLTDRQRIRHQVGHGTGRPRRLPHDPRRVQPATATRQARPRPILRPAHAPSPQGALPPRR
jgi:hypothetical protein